MTPEEYLKFLENYLNELLGLGSIEESYKTSTMERARELLRAGTNPTTLPHFFRLYKDFMGWLTEEEKRGAVPELSPFQREQVARWAQLDEVGMKQAEESQRRWGMEFSESQRQFAIREGRLADAQRFAQQQSKAQQRESRMGLAAQWEIEKMRQLRTLGNNPWNWIQRWFAQNDPNPFTPAPSANPLQDKAREGLDLIRDAEERLSSLVRQRAPWRAGETEEKPSITGHEVLLARKELESLQKEYNPAIQEQQSLAQEAMATGRWPEPVRKPVLTTPPWLTQFTGLTAGEPLKKAEITTPSGQMWARTSPSVRAGLGGFAEWQGGRTLEDIVQHMQSMAPRAPRGAGFQFFRPRRQMA